MQIKIKEKYKKIKVKNAHQIGKILQDILESEDEIDRDKEHFWAICFNSRNNIVRIDLIGLGTVNAGLVHPRETFRPAVASSAVSIIVAHNHPSGDTEPSEADLKITKRLKEAGNILGIDLLDSLIITKDAVFSFAEKGLIPTE